jgi:hypothetical protein
MHRHVPLHALAAYLCAPCSVLRAVPRIFQCILTLAATGLVTGMINSIENLARQGRVPWSACLLVGCELLGEWASGWDLERASHQGIEFQLYEGPTSVGYVSAAGS